MRAGDLRHRVTLYRQAIVRDSMGGETITDTALATVWASVKPVSGTEYFTAGQMSTRITHRIRMRWRADVNSKVKIKFEGRTFDIDTALNYGERRKQLDIYAVERNV